MVDFTSNAQMIYIILMSTEQN